MFKKSVLTVLVMVMLAIALCASAQNQPVPPARKADVSKVAACANKLCATGMKLDNTGNPYFDSDGMRYTIGAGPTSLALWVRPVGTTAKKDRKEFIDHDLNGTVEEGSNGNIKEYFKAWGDRTFGLELREYYQRGYNQTLATILEYIASHPKP